MVAIWPGTLPQSPLLAGYQEQRGEGRRFSQTDTGPGKVFRKTSAYVRPLNINILMTTAQLETLEEFYQNDLDEGALPFELPNPRATGTILVRFKENGLSWDSPNGLHFVVQMQLEIMP